MIKYTIYFLLLLFFIILVLNPMIYDVHQYIPANVPKDLRAYVPNNISLIDAIFGFCVWLLILCADIFGVSYNEINIWVFVFIWPAILVIMVIYILRLRSVIAILRRRTAALELRAVQDKSK